MSFSTAFKVERRPMVRDGERELSSGGDPDRVVQAALQETATAVSSSFPAATSTHIDNMHVTVVGRDYFQHTTNIVINQPHLHDSDVGMNDSILRDLPNPIDTSFDTSKTCIPGTRTRILDEISTWSTRELSTSETATIMLLADAAGTGKSYIMHSISERLHLSRHLLASYCFSQTNRQHSSTRDFLSVIIRRLFNIDAGARASITAKLAEDPTLATSPAARLFADLIIPAATALPPCRSYVIVVDALDEGYDPALIDILWRLVPRLPPCIRFFITTRPEDRIMSKLAHWTHVRTYGVSLSGVDTTEDIRLFVNHICDTSEELAYAVAKPLRDALVKRSEGMFLWASIVLAHTLEALNPAYELERVISSSSEFWSASEDAQKRLEAVYHGVLSSLPWADPEFSRAFTSVVGTLAVAQRLLSVQTLSTLLSHEGITQPMVIKVLKRIRPLLDGFDPTLPDKLVKLLHLSVLEYLTAPHTDVHYRISPGAQHHRVALACMRTINRELTVERYPFLGFVQLFFEFDETSDSWRDLEMPQVSNEAVPDHLTYACWAFGHHLQNLDCGLDSDIHQSLCRTIVRKKGVHLLELTAACGRVLDLWPFSDWWLKRSKEGQDERENLGIAIDSMRASLFLDHCNRPHEAISTINVALNILDTLDRTNTFYRFAEAWCLLSRGDYNMGSGQWTCMERDLWEAVRILEGLHADTWLESYLPNLMKCSAIVSLGTAHYFQHRFQEAVASANDAPVIQKRLEAVEPSDSTSLVLRALALANIQRAYMVVETSPITAVEYSEERFGILKDLSEKPESRLQINQRISRHLRLLFNGEKFEQPAFYLLEGTIQRTYTYNQAELDRAVITSLQDMGTLYSPLGRYADARAALQEAISLSSRTDDDNLPWSYYHYAKTTSKEGAHYDLARSSAEKAVELFRQLHLSQPDVMDHRRGLVFSLNQLARASLHCGLHHGVIAFVEEMVGVIRDPESTGMPDSDAWWAEALGMAAEASLNLGELTQAKAYIEDAIGGAEGVANQYPYIQTEVLPSLWDLRNRINQRIKEED